MQTETRKALTYAAHDAMWTPPQPYKGEWHTGQHEPPETPQEPVQVAYTPDPPSRIPAWLRRPVVIETYTYEIPAWMRRAAGRSET